MSEIHPPTFADYEFIVEPHRRAMLKLELELGFFLHDVRRLNVFSVSSRTKVHRRALAKADHLGISVAALDDLAGVRIVVGTHAEVPVVERFFTRQEDGKDIKILNHQKIDRESGYRATHILIEKNSHYQSSVFPGRIEVQIHTIFEHAFNFLSRNWSYKQPWQTLPQWSEKFAKISQLLSEIDTSAEELHFELAKLQSTIDSAELTPYSMQLIIEAEFGEEVSLTDCVDACRMYVDLGCKTNAHLRGHFRDRRIVELYELNQARSASAVTVAPLGGMSKNTFWSIFGTRIDSPGLKEFFSAIPPDI